tara:strand:+ start:102 stop:536 length:435 start_codon:yes stop_codon:yes gene_type:complete
MKIKIQKSNFCPSQELQSFLERNNSGSVISFLGKVRGNNNKKKVVSIDITLYKKMAFFQLKKIVKKVFEIKHVDDYLIIHRYGNLLPNENIVFIIVATKHRKEGFFFLEKVINFLKIRVTFWKKENYLKTSEWVKQKSSDVVKL